MSQQDDSAGSRSDDPCFICPRCGKIDVRPAVRTKAGAYCQCHGCGYIWHIDNVPAISKSTLRRRKTDGPV